MTDAENPTTASGTASSSPESQREALRRVPVERTFEQALEAAGLWPLVPASIETLQVNVGRRCNQSCRHCHVGAGPDRPEMMGREVFELCLEVLADRRLTTADITGGAPELNPHFRWFVDRCRALGKRVIDRCNLTVLDLPDQKDVPEFLAERSVEIVCSLPHWRALTTERQRGLGVHAASLEAIRRLNALGYGDGRSGRKLIVVSNPAGAILPGDQSAVERDFRENLGRDHGIVFDQLFCMSNVPIGRFLDWLLASSNLEGYLGALVRTFNPAAARGVMCRNLVSVGWKGDLYDCDFNQVLDLPCDPAGLRHLSSFDLTRLEKRQIVVGPHCFACTAGGGSSCGGATAGKKP